MLRYHAAVGGASHCGQHSCETCIAAKDLEDAASQLQDMQQSHVREAGLVEKFSWHATLKDTPPIEGVFFSNELPDSFPVHRIVFEKGIWKESFVRWDAQNHAEIAIQILNTDMERSRRRSRQTPSGRGTPRYGLKPQQPGLTAARDG